MQENLIDSLVARIAEDMKVESNHTVSAPAPRATEKMTEPKPVSKPVAVLESQNANGKYSVADYPLMEKHYHMIQTPTGKSLDEITLENVVKGNIKIEDVRISPEMLLNQADIAESAGKTQVAENLRRAAEMAVIEDDMVIKMYDMLRPNRATKAQLIEMAEALKNKYQANLLAKLVTEACEVYEKRGILLKG